MKILNIIKKLLRLPFAIVGFIPFVIISFFITDFENEWDVNYLKKSIKRFIW